MRTNGMSVLLSEAASILSRVGVSSPQLDARLIMGHVLGMEDVCVLINPDYQLTSVKVREFFQAIAKRVSGVPVSHILGKREFWGMNFVVNSNVLDPRPDTETIVETVIKLCTNKNRRISIADLGTGTGCVIIALLSHYKNAVGVAFEKSASAYGIARQNVAHHSMLGRIKLHHASWEQCRGKYDIIVSNPPYIKRCKIRKLQTEVRMHEPHLALDGGVRGIEKYIQIFQVIRRCLKPTGVAVVEIGEDQLALRNEAPKWGIRFCQYVHDLAGHKRCVVLKKML